MAGNVIPFPSYGGPVVHCVTAEDGAAVDDCKGYIARGGYARDQVKIVQKDGCTMVIALAKLW